MTGKGSIGVLSLSLLNIAAVLSIVNFPAQAEYGYGIVFYICAGAICFFIPVALVSAELTSAWPRNGGLYLWGKLAFSPRVGFVIDALQWLNSLPWYATVLTFIATTVAYMFDPGLAANRWFVYFVVVGSMWMCTLLNCRGIRTYAFVSGAGATVGTIIPTIIIIGTLVVYLLMGNAPAIPFRSGELLPQLHSLKDWMLLAGMLVSLAGIDMPSVHVTDVKNPRRNFPLALLIASIVIIAASVAGSLAIALVVPPGQLSMASGAGQAFEAMFDRLGVAWMTPVMCVLLIVGALATVITWILGPSRALFEVAREGYLPKFMARANSHGVPSRILFIQAGITSTLALAIFFMPNISGAFWYLMAQSAIMYMTMYTLMFLAALKMRSRYPLRPRPFSVPGGTLGMGAVCVIGIISAVTAQLCGLIPPESVRSHGVGAGFLYSGMLLAVTGFFAAIPLWLVARRRRAQRREAEFLRSRRRTERISARSRS